MLISVVMSVYNGERYLDASIRSILSQTEERFELILINDGSNDGSGDIIDRFAAMDKRIKTHHQDNRGLIESLNWGCREAKGLYIARMDADDVAVPDRFERQLRVLEERPALALLGGGMEIVAADGITPLYLQNAITEDSELRRRLLEWNCFAHNTVMMRRHAFHAVGGYRSAFRDAEDYDLWCRIAERFEVGNLSEPLVKYRIHNGQVSGSKLESQIISALSAKHAYRARISGFPDPYSGLHYCSAEALEELGVSRRELDREVIQAYIARYRLPYARPEERLMLLVQAAQYCRRRASEPRLAATIVSLLARNCKGKGRRIAAAEFVRLTAHCPLGLVIACYRVARVSAAQ